MKAVKLLFSVLCVVMGVATVAVASLSTFISIHPVILGASFTVILGSWNILEALYVPAE